jgi:hypothetical protein
MLRTGAVSTRVFPNQRNVCILSQSAAQRTRRKWKSSRQCRRAHFCT